MWPESLEGSCHCGCQPQMDQNSHVRAETVNMLVNQYHTITDCYSRDEVELRARTNIALQQNIDFITLRQWYNIFNVTGIKEVYLKPPPGVKNAKGSAFCLELFIHEDIVSFRSIFVYLFIISLISTVLWANWRKWWGRDGWNVIKTWEETKRAKKPQQELAGVQANQRYVLLTIEHTSELTYCIWLSDGHPRSTSQVLTSRFAHDDAGLVDEPIVASADPIHFKRTICTISPDDGRYSFTELSTVETGILDQNTMFLSIADRGKTKDVYGVSCITTRIEGYLFITVSDDHQGWAVRCQKTDRHRKWSWTCTLARSCTVPISRPCSVEEDGILCQGVLHTWWTGGCWINMYSLSHYLLCRMFAYDGL